jgi:Family of unknown function (DUF6152)
LGASVFAELALWKRGRREMKYLWRGMVAGILLTAAAWLAGPAAAHHSAFMYDQDKTVTIEGVVKDFQYTNPHSWLIVETKNADGTLTSWGFEAEGPSTLMRAGIRRSTLTPGTKITITGHPMKDGRPAAAWVQAVLADGTVLNPRAGFVPK